MEDFMDLLKIYYSRVFPLDDYYKWLSYGDGKQINIYKISILTLLLLFITNY